MMLLVMVSWLLCVVGGSTPPAEPDTPPPSDGEPRELVPGVVVGEGFVEFRGTVCADASYPETPVVYLELLVTGPDTREHESLVVTTVKPSAIHAGLLAAGMEAGHPVRWEDGELTEKATGDRVRVEVAVVGEDGPGDFVDLASWAVNKENGRRLTDAEGWGLVFAGSVLDDEGYAADRAGTIIGLTGFGTEVVAASWSLSPAASVDEPVWIVDKEAVAAFGKPVVVRVSGVKEPAGEKKGEEKVDEEQDSRPEVGPTEVPP